MNLNEEQYTVGELAKIAGITVRTLQYYDGCGLLTCAHGEGGRRVYGRGDFIRLQQILFLKSFGFSLKEIRDRLLDVNSSEDLAAMLNEQKQALTARIESLSTAIKSIDGLTNELEDSGDIGPDKFVALMELTKLSNPYSFMLRYFSNRQVSEIASKFEDKQFADEFTNDINGMFEQIIALVRTGEDPESEKSQALAAQCWQLVSKFSGGNPEMLQTLFAAGQSADKWPEENAELSVAMKGYFSVAMYKYLSGIGFPFEKFNITE